MNCHHCPTVLNVSTVTADRITPGYLGGTYRRDNIRPSCTTCASRQGAEIANEHKRAKRKEPVT